MRGVARRVLIAGGSLGGITAALTLRDVGCDVEVYERSRAPLEGRGAGIVLHPATIRYFIESGAMDVGRVSSKAEWLRYLDRGGDTIHEAPCRYWFTSYYTLHKGLLDCFDETRYHLGAGMTGLRREADSITLELNNEEVTGDLLVCADGIHSTGRRILLPDVLPRYAGYVGWRGTVREDELSAGTLGLLRDACTYFVGDRTHILTYPIPDFDGSVEPGNRRINFVWYRNVAEGPALDDLMTDVHGVRQEISLAPGAVRQNEIEGLLAAATEQLPECIAEVVVKSKEPFVQAVFDIAVPRMVFGRACLIGDAAFAIRPHAAAGTAKAAEDGWRLAAAMRSESGDVLAALRRWEPNQLALGHTVMERSREIGRRAQVSGTYEPGDPNVAFGLYEPEDSWITVEKGPAGLASSAERPKM
jgi:2,6-dihydroxypyridine 3-monooxygenase